MPITMLIYALLYIIWNLLAIIVVQRLCPRIDTDDFFYDWQMYLGLFFVGGPCITIVGIITFLCYLVVMEDKRTRNEKSDKKN